MTTNGQRSPVMASGTPNRASAPRHRLDQRGLRANVGEVGELPGVSRRRRCRRVASAPGRDAELLAPCEYSGGRVGRRPTRRRRGRATPGPCGTFEHHAPSSCPRARDRHDVAPPRCEREREGRVGTRHGGREVERVVGGRPHARFEMTADLVRASAGDGLRDRAPGSGRQPQTPGPHRRKSMITHQSNAACDRIAGKSLRACRAIAPPTRGRARAPLLRGPGSSQPPGHAAPRGSARGRAHTEWRPTPRRSASRLLPRSGA